MRSLGSLEYWLALAISCARAFWALAAFIVNRPAAESQTETSKAMHINRRRMVRILPTIKITGQRRRGCGRASDATVGRASRSAATLRESAADFRIR